MRSQPNVNDGEAKLFQRCQGVIFLLGIPTIVLLYGSLGSNGSWVFVVLAICLSALLFAIWLVRWLINCDDGNELMKGVAEPIKEGAEAFLRVQYGAILKITLLVCALLFLAFLFREPPRATKANHFAIGTVHTAIITCASFVTGACFSAASGYVGMWVSVRANLRVASAAARNKYSDAMAIALRGGAFCGLLVVTLCIFGLSLLFFVLQAVFSQGPADDLHLPHLLVGYGFGASLVALFAQLGGGIFTKAADVGADMVGKVEANIPEDDPRNPVVIADLVGDNVGDCAGRGADLFESIAGEIIGAMIIGADLAHHAALPEPLAFMFFPVLIHALDLVVSSVAVMLTKPRRLGLGRSLPTMDDVVDAEKGQDLMSQYEDPMDCLKRGYSIALFLAVIAIGFLARSMLYIDTAPGVWLHFFGCALTGVLTSFLFLHVTQFYTDYRHAPVQRIALACKTGHGTSVIAGVAVGLESTALPTVIIVAALLGSFWLGETCGLVDGLGRPVGGLFGTAIATMGMLSTAVFVLAMDTFGPITDNAGGIVEMSRQPDYVRDITDRLDAVGNVTKATTKGYSIGAAGLASFLLFRAFLDVVNTYTGARSPFELVNIAIPEVFLSGLLGGMLVMLFSAFAIAAVGRTAQEVVVEVREQFLNKPGILLNTEKPDYDRCVAIVTSASLREMVKPGFLAILLPVLVGFGMRLVGAYTQRPLLGVECVAAFVMFATATGILMALFFNNAGGAWDNAKKYIETGAHGGKGSEAHKSAVTGDTVGDPFKDTAGPSLHVLIKLLSTITLVLCPLFMSHA